MKQCCMLVAGKYKIQLQDTIIWSIRLDKFFLKEQKQKFNNTKGKQECGAAGHSHIFGGNATI